MGRRGASVKAEALGRGLESAIFLRRGGVYPRLSPLSTWEEIMGDEIKLAEKARAAG